MAAPNDNNVMNTDNETKRCRFCNRLGSPYTCPRCNFPYCSSKCYAKPEHYRCSEMFYKDWVEIHLRQSKNSPETQKGIARILQRVHQKEEAEELDSDDEDDIPDLHERFSGLDLDSLDTDDIWERLTTDEKQEFQRLVEDELADNVLPLWQPWWHLKEETKLVQEMEGSNQDTCPLMRCPPVRNEIPPLKDLLSVPPSKHLKYNIINALYAYAYITRFYNGDYNEFALESTQCMLNISKCLGSNQSCVNIEDAVISAIFQLEQNKELENSQAFVIEMIDEVRRILEGPNHKDSTHYILAALSDMESMVKTVKNSTKTTKNNLQTAQKSVRGSVDKDFIMKVRHVEKKLIFYMSWVKEYPQELHLLMLELNVLHAAKLNAMIRFEAQQKAIDRDITRKNSNNSTVKIEEI